MKKLCLILLVTFSMSAWETPIDNKEVYRDPRVAIYIPAPIGSTEISQKLLESIDGQPVIKRTYDRAKFIRRANRVCVVTNNAEIASAIGEDALFIDKEYVNGTERICDAFFNHSDHNEAIIVKVQGDEPYLEPTLIDYAIQKFQENESDPTLGAVSLHYELSPKEAAQPSRIKVVVDQNNHLLAGNRTVIPHKKSSRYFGQLGVMVYRADALKKFCKESRMPLETSEDSDWTKLHEMGYTIKSFKVANPVERNVNTPQDVAALSEKYSKPRIFLPRSGSFSQHFIEKTNALWPVRDGDIVCRCQRTHGSNLELFNERIDYVFFRLDKQWVNHRTLKSKTFIGNPSDTSVAVVYSRRMKSSFKEFIKKNKVENSDVTEFILDEFKKANNFQHIDVVERSVLTDDFKTLTGTSGPPTLGFIGTSYLRRHFPDHLIVLCDFTFQGDFGHKWKEEKQYALHLEQEGHLIRLLEKTHEK